MDFKKSFVLRTNIKDNNYLLSVNSKDLSTKFNENYRSIVITSYLKLILDGSFNLQYIVDNLEHQKLIDMVLSRPVSKLKIGFKYYTFYEYLLNCFTEAKEVNGTFIFNRDQMFPLARTNVFLGLVFGHRSNDERLEFTADYSDLLYMMVRLKVVVDRLAEHQKAEEHIISKGAKLILTNQHNIEGKGMDSNFVNQINDDLGEFANSDSTDITLVYPKYLVAWLDTPESLRADYMDIRYMSIMREIASILQIPMTKLIGKSPDGMNSTGESDERHYQDTCINYAKMYIVPMLERIIFLVYNETVSIELKGKEIFNENI